MKTLAYAYVSPRAVFVVVIAPVRAQVFYVWNGVLVGREFTSSFATDRTEFDTSKVLLTKSLSGGLPC